MNKEEQKAIEYWKRDIKLYHYNTQLASEYYAQILLNLIQKQEKKINQLNQVLNDRVDVKQTADSISFTMPSKVAEASIKVLEESALVIENKRLSKLLEKQEKIIDKMAEELYFDCWDRVCQECCKECEKDMATQSNCIKEYFKKEVEKECEK